METVILIFLSLFATIGIAFIVDGIIKHLTYQPMSVKSMELQINLSGDNEGLTDMISVLSDELFFYHTANGSAVVKVVNGGLSEKNVAAIRNLCKYKDNVEFTEDI